MIESLPALLREEAKDPDRNWCDYYMIEAANEIERLRLVISCLQNEVLRLAEIAWKAEVD